MFHDLTYHLNVYLAKWGDHTTWQDKQIQTQSLRYHHCHTHTHYIFVSGVDVIRKNIAVSRAVS
jgi:hypothetical protein